MKSEVKNNKQENVKSSSISITNLEEIQQKFLKILNPLVEPLNLRESYNRLCELRDSINHLNQNGSTDHLSKQMKLLFNETLEHNITAFQQATDSVVLAESSEALYYRGLFEKEFESNFVKSYSLFRKIPQNDPFFNRANAQMMGLLYERRVIDKKNSENPNDSLVCLITRPEESPEEKRKRLLSVIEHGLKSNTELSDCDLGWAKKAIEDYLSHALSDSDSKYFNKILNGKTSLQACIAILDHEKEKATEISELKKNNVAQQEKISRLSTNQALLEARERVLMEEEAALRQENEALKEKAQDAEEAFRRSTESFHRPALLLSRFERPSQAPIGEGKPRNEEKPSPKLPLLALHV